MCPSKRADLSLLPYDQKRPSSLLLDRVVPPYDRWNPSPLQIGRTAALGADDVPSVVQPRVVWRQIRPHAASSCFYMGMIRPYHVCDGEDVNRLHAWNVGKANHCYSTLATHADQVL